MRTPQSLIDVAAINATPPPWHSLIGSRRCEWAKNHSLSGDGVDEDVSLGKPVKRLAQIYKHTRKYSVYFNGTDGSNNRYCFQQDLDFANQRRNPTKDAVMDPTSSMFEALMYPTALFSAPVPNPRPTSLNIDAFHHSPLNPKNRLNNLHLPPNIQWRIDGGEADGTRLFAVPAFAIGRPPLRIDVYIPSQLNQPPELLDALNSYKTILLAGSELQDIGVCRLVLQRLQMWLEGTGDLEAAYMSMPFGSQIILEEIQAEITKIPIHLVPDYSIERRWLSVQELQTMWQLPTEKWPPILDHDDLQLLRQPHEAISIVRIRQHLPSEIFVFKSVSTEVKYLYHELKMLITMDPHRHIMPAPVYVVTKKTRFGGKSGVCGFILSYIRDGTLRDALGKGSLHSRSVISLRDRVRWSKQLLSALRHISSGPMGFYTDLKPNNVLLSEHESEMGVVLVDFEQRGSWFSWSPPEVYYVEYLEILASATHKCPANIRTLYKDLLTKYMPDWKPQVKNRIYTDSSHGFSQAWCSLSESERETAQVFMVGKLLWCIFEDIPFPGSCVTVETFREDPSDQCFPEFRRTPPLLRECIRQCTSGAPEWRGRIPSVVRLGDRLYPRGRTGEHGEPEGTWPETQTAAQAWWQVEVEAAEQFIGARIRQREGVELDGDDGILGFMCQRPSLEQVELAIGQIVC